MDLFRPVQFPCPLVHQSDDEPGLLEMVVLVVYLSVGLVQRPSMVDPVRTMLIHEGKEQLVILRHAQLRHHTLEGVVVPRELRAPYGSDICTLEVLELVVEKAVRVTVPEECIDIQRMVDEFNLFVFR